MADHNDYSRSRVAFRPSAYSQPGLAPVQPYTPAWPQGMEYGGWFDYTPAGWAMKKYAERQEGSVGGTCKDQAGLLGTPGAMVSCAALSDAQQGNAPGTTSAYVPDSGGITDYTIGESARGAAKAVLPDALVPDSIDFPDWAPSWLKDDAELEEEEEEEKKKFRRQLTLVGLGMATVLGSIFLYQRGEKKKIEAGGKL